VTTQVGQAEGLAVPASHMDPKAITPGSSDRKPW